ncbi:MAG: hypothetical protein ABI207_00415 [Crocinitomicaceae bacterium]
MIKRLGFFTLLLYLFFSCGKDVPTPAYLQINKYSLLENIDAVSPQGALSNNFSDAWVYIDGKLMGVFELPVKLPIGQAGGKTITIVAGVRNNGIESTKKRFPFVENYETYVTLTPNETTVVNPTTRYYSTLSFWIEDFEDPTSVALTETYYSKAHLHASSDPSILKYGAYFGEVDLTTQDSLWDAITSDQLVLPPGREVYLEIDYYTTNSILTGINAYNVSGGTSTQNPNILINQQSADKVVWKKIYIDLNEIVSYDINANYFKIALTSILSVEEQSSSKICIDNIKVIHN